MRKLCLFTLGLTLCCLVRVLLPQQPVWLPALGLLPLAAVWLLGSGRLRRGAAILALAAAAGLCWCEGYAALFLRPLQALGDAPAEIHARITGNPEQTDRGLRVRASIGLDGRSFEGLFYYDDAELSPGDEVSCEASLRSAFSRFQESGRSFDLSRGVLLRASARGALTVTSPERPPLRVLPARLCARLLHAIDAAFAADSAGFVRALLLGERSGLSFAQRTQLSNAGIYHTVAVSGMHVSILLGMLLQLVRDRRLAALLGLPALALFTLVTGAGASAVRAAVMQALLLLAPLLGRENDPPTSLAAALLVLVLQNPWCLLDVGLQLSFCSTAGILLFCSKVYRGLGAQLHLEKTLRRRTFVAALLRAGLTALSCSVCAQAFSLPVLAVQFGVLSLIAPVSNVLCLWAVSLLFSLGLLTALLALALPAAAAAAGWALSWLARYILFMAEKLSALPYASVSLEEPYFLVFAALVYAMLLLVCRKPDRKRLSWAAGAGAVGLCLCALLSAWSFRAPSMQCVMLDVGQGQCILLSGNGKTAAVDCGGDSEASGEEAALYLRTRGCFSLDALVLTHFDRDHCNGAAQLLSRVRVKTLYLPQNGDETSAWRAAVLRAAEDRGCEIVFVPDMDEFSLKGLSVRLYAAECKGADSNAGLCVLASKEKYDILITGDLPALGEYRLLAQRALSDVEVLVAGHHGARESTSQVLLDRLGPELALISVGAENAYGHPAPETLARLAQAGIEIYRTDACGTIVLRR